MDETAKASGYISKRMAKIQEFKIGARVKRATAMATGIVSMITTVLRLTQSSYLTKD